MIIVDANIIIQHHTRKKPPHFQTYPTTKLRGQGQLTNGDSLGLQWNVGSDSGWMIFVDWSWQKNLAAGTQLYDEIREAKGQRVERMIKTVRRDPALRNADPW